MSDVQTVVSDDVQKHLFVFPSKSLLVLDLTDQLPVYVISKNLNAIEVEAGDQLLVHTYFSEEEVNNKSKTQEMQNLVPSGYCHMHLCKREGEDKYGVVFGRNTLQTIEKTYIE